MRGDLPTGTVTFLFTDVEGSTKLLHELGAEAYAEALAEHRRAIREACAAQGGVEVDMQGDAFFFAFPTAPGAIAAAEAMTSTLADGPIQVRIGLHTGTPLLSEEGYVGDDVHRAARIAASAHGSQVICSKQTRELVELELTDLGEHRLKDIAEAVPIYQLGEGSFPPLKTISNTNLPTPASSFVGRDDELLEVLARFEDGARLVTLTGPGGTGKTRLAIEAAAELVPEYKAGVFWVGLATLRDPALVTERIAQTLGAKDALAEHIGEREMLLLLDNFEQVIDAAPELSWLVASCPNLRLLVTSRELLRIHGEVEYPVPSLAENEAVELFCARSQLGTDDTIAKLCRRLDSLPLAVELAAARTSALTPTQILERLAQRLDLLKGGRDAEARQQTLRAAIEWSYDLLTPEEQRLFARISVFVGCTIDAAEEVADADLDTLQSLVEKSLLRFKDERYWMLETIREYASERLEEAGQSEQFGRRHAAYFAGAADHRWPELMIIGGEWRDAVRRELENLHRALELSLDQGHERFALAIVSGIWYFWLGDGYGRYARRSLERAVSLAPGDRSEHRAHALAALGNTAHFQGDLEDAERALEEALMLFRELAQPRWVAAQLTKLADVARALGDLAHARELAVESLAMRRELEPGLIGRGLESLAFIELAGGDLRAARALFEESLIRYREEAPEMSVLEITEGLGEVARCEGDYRTALALFGEALRGAALEDNRLMIVRAFDSLAALWASLDDVARAARLGGAAEHLRETSGLVRLPDAPPLPKRIEPSWCEGRAMSLDGAVEYALSGID